MISVIRRMKMYVYIAGSVFLVYGPWALVYTYVPYDELLSTGTDKTCSPGICMGATTGFWLKKSENNPRVTNRRAHARGPFLLFLAHTRE